MAEAQEKDVNKDVDRASILISERKYGEAADILNNLFLNFQNSPRVLFYLGRLYRKLEEYDKAEEFLLKTVLFDPQGPKSYLIYHELGQLYYEAADSYENENNYKKAAEYFWKAIEINKDSMTSYLMLTSIYAIRRDFEMALRVCDDAIKTLEESAYKSIISKNEQAEKFSLDDCKKETWFEPKFNEVLKTERFYSRFLFQKSRLFLSSGEIDTAKAFLAKAINFAFDKNSISFMQNVFLNALSKILDEEDFLRESREESEAKERRERKFFKYRSGRTRDLIDEMNTPDGYKLLKAFGINRFMADDYDYEKYADFDRFEHEE